MKARTRFIQSVVKTAATTPAPLPWAARKAAKAHPASAVEAPVLRRA